VVAGSALAFGAVHPFAYVPLWIASAVLALLVAWRAAEVRTLRARLGRTRIALSGRRLLPGDNAGAAPGAWTFDLGWPLLPKGALLLPGVAFLAWVALQLLPFPAGWKVTSASPSDTVRGMAFVAAALSIHGAAAAVFLHRPARLRFRRFVAALGLVLAVTGLVQLAGGARRIYGYFEPYERGSLFGPFANRNHFAGYMLMVALVALDLLSRAWRRLRGSMGRRAGLRPALVRLGTPEGAGLVYALVPAVAAVGALLATTSRGAIAAFVVALALAGLGLRHRGDVPSWALGLLVVGMALAWFGMERLELRFDRAADDAPGRTIAWRDALQRMDGRWIAGWGFNTFGFSISRVTPWPLPEGATPWPDWLDQAVARGERPGTRLPADLAGGGWYREAHNDYVQLVVETGVPGLLIGLWAGVAVLRRARADPWLFAALASVLMHTFVEFDFQIPALPVLFVTLAALHT